MRKLVLAVLVVVCGVPWFAPSPATAAIGVAPKRVDAWAWCGVHPDLPLAAATVLSMANAGGIDATFGPCYPGYPGYSAAFPNNPPNFRYVQPDVYMRLVQLNASVGMKTVVYDARVWSPVLADRNAAVAFWTPVIGSIAAWDMGDEFDPNSSQWQVLRTRWNQVLSDVAVRTRVQPFANHLESAVDAALAQIPGAANLLSYTRYDGDLGASTARRLDSQVQTLMCGVNAFTHGVPGSSSFVFVPTAEKILTDAVTLVGAGCDRLLIFGGQRVYDYKEAGGYETNEGFGPPSLADFSGAPTDWATATFEAQGRSTYRPAGPARLLETRPGLATIDGQSNGIGLRANGTITEVQVAGRAGIAANATSAALNVTATNSVAPGFLTVFPCGTAPPNAAQVNYEMINVATAVIAKLAANGKVCIFNSAATDIVVDVNGYLPLGSSFMPLSPARVLETRPGMATVDGAYNGVGFRGGGSVTELQIWGRGGVPIGASDAVLNVTAVNAAAAGFVTVYPCSSGVPTASNVNYVVGAVATNAVIAPLSDIGRLCIYTSANIDLVIDVNGYYPEESSFVSTQPSRFLDTRAAPAPPVQGIELEPGSRDPNPPIILQVAGRGGVPTTAQSAVINLTVTEATGAGFVTVYPCGTPRPNASNLNFLTGATVANMVVAGLGAQGTICIFKSIETQIVVDVTNFHP